MNTEPFHPTAQRPRQQNDRDCVIAVFREVTGEDERTALSRFKQYHRGTEGFTLEDLSDCFLQAGWMMVRDGREIPLHEPAFSTFWKTFTDLGILEYCVKGANVGHVVVIKSGGIVLDPTPRAPEEGEFISGHLDQYRGAGQINFSLSKVFRP